MLLMEMLLDRLLERMLVFLRGTTGATMTMAWSSGGKMADHGRSRDAAAVADHSHSNEYIVYFVEVWVHINAQAAYCTCSQTYCTYKYTCSS